MLAWLRRAWQERRQFLLGTVSGVVILSVITGVIGNYVYDGLTKADESSANNGRQRQQAPMLPKPAPKPCVNDWQKCEGFGDLRGLWRGKIPGGPVVAFELSEVGNGNESIRGSMTIADLSCTARLRLAHVDEMFTTSKFFFKPVSLSGKCPDIDTLEMMPVSTSAQSFIVLKDGREWSVVLGKRIP